MTLTVSDESVLVDKPLGANLEQLICDGVTLVYAPEFLKGTYDLDQYKAPKTPTIYKPFFCIDLIDCPIAHDENLIALIEAYYGTKPRLRETRLVLTIPTPGPPIRSQLWHRDPGVGKRILVFLYLNDVSMENSPFCYVPGTHSMGMHRAVTPPKLADIDERDIRFTDEEMAKVLPKWRYFGGPKGAMVIADTLGYHRGLKPVSGSRLALNIVYECA